jgi:hypothetical protein
MGERLGCPIDSTLISAVADPHPVHETSFASQILLGRLADLIGKKQYEKVRIELDFFIVRLCGMARQGLGLDPIKCLAGSYEEIKDRKGVMYNGMFIKESDPAYNDAVAAIQAERAAKAEPGGPLV